MAGPPPDYFARVRGSVNFRLLQNCRVVIVGIGTVGSRIADLLARSGIGHLRLIDHDPLQVENLFRHALPPTYLDWNKAAGLADWLGRQVPGLHVTPIERRIDDSVPAELLERWLSDADLIVAATDDREAQRRIGHQALVLGVPALFPGHYPEGGGEVFAQTTSRQPCFGCWDYFRGQREPLRGVSGLPFAELPLISTTLRLCVGMLDSGSEYRTMPIDEDGGRYHSFRIDPFGNYRGAHQERRANCPSCGGTAGPPPGGVASDDPPSPPPRPQTPPAPPPQSPPRAWSDAKVNALAILAPLVGIGLLVAIIVGIISLSSHHTAPAEVSHPFSIHVDYGQSLADMISTSALDKGENSAHVTERAFPITSGPSTVEVVLVHLTHLEVNPDVAAGISEDPDEYTQWLSALHKLGLRPATLPELLAFSAQYSYWESDLDVVELGTLSPETGNSDGLEYVSVSNGTLEAHPTSEGGFDELGYQYRFLAVRE